MSEHNKSTELQANTLLVIEHLQLESQHLDTVIESSLEMQSILRERRAIEPEIVDPDAPKLKIATPPNAIQKERNERMNKRLDILRSNIAREFLPVLESRKSFVQVLNAISPNQDRTPSVTALALMVDEPVRSQLKKLRNDIRSKLNQVQSISMGNQAVLIYTLDFYGRLLTGLTQNDQPSNYYDANGQSKSHFAGSLIRTNC